ncbi:MAG: hypothetical protein WD872_09900, partial [Pirellulaceae bacterium]
MSVSIPVFWQLLQESRLLAPDQCSQLVADFQQAHAKSDPASAAQLAEWLVARHVLSKYQTNILLAGRSGPFQYGDYKVYDRIEKGRLSGQFRAVHAPSGHPVLLQFLNGPLVADPPGWAACVAQVRVASAIVSPHVQRAYEAVDLGSFKFLAGEDLRGAALDEHLAGRRLPPQEACRIARLAAIGLAQMHQSRRTHGNVRPANLLLEAIGKTSGNVKLLFDAHQPPAHFDPSRPESADRLALAGDYLAPELASPGRMPDPLADVYALGCSLYEM